MSTPLPLWLRARRRAMRAARRLARPIGLELIPRGRQEPFPTEDYDIAPRDGYQVIPRGRQEPFPTEEYDIAPRDGYQVIPRGRAEPFTADAYEVAPSDRFQVIARGRTERFTAEDYDVLPRGRYDVVRHDYYSPVPDLTLLPEDVWTRRSAMGGIELRLDEAIRLVETDLAPFVTELDVPRDGPSDLGVFYLHNGTYGAVDAELLYAMVRHGRPRRLVELGSGFTTLLTSLACRRNAEEGAPVDHVAYDPYPRRHILGDAPPAGTRFEAVAATDVPMEVFTALQAGDILFVDTTHTVKLGGDVNFVVLDVLPRLAPGVIVHFHDIFLPWEYPREWFEVSGYLWAEQYLVQAFLAFNREFEVLLPAHALVRERFERLRAVVPSLKDARTGGALWLQRAAR